MRLVLLFGMTSTFINFAYDCWLRASCYDDLSAHEIGFRETVCLSLSRLPEKSDLDVYLKYLGHLGSEHKCNLQLKENVHSVNLLSLLHFAFTG